MTYLNWHFLIRYILSTRPECRKWFVRDFFLTSERSEEVPFLRGVLWGVERTRVPAFAVFSTEVALFIGVGCWYLGKLGFGRSPTELLRRFLKSAIYRGTLFSGQNAKTGPGRARSHVGVWNLVQRYIFSMREDWGGLFLDSNVMRHPKHVTWCLKHVTWHPWMSCDDVQNMSRDTP